MNRVKLRSVAIHKARNAKRWKRRRRIIGGHSSAMRKGRKSD